MLRSSGILGGWDMSSDSNWSVVKTGDIFDLINGYAFKSREFIAQGAPVLKIKNVKAGALNLDNLSYVDPGFLATKPDKVVQKNDLLITMSGNRHDGSMETWVGKVCWFGSDSPYLVNQRVGTLRLKNIVDENPRFLAYQLSSESFQKHFIAVATSSGGQANLAPTQINSTELLLPPRTVQDWIVSVVGGLEDKIQLNHQINQTLEQMAQALFKSWFVDFEPVKAKIAALEAGGSEEDALLAAMQAISGTSLCDADASATSAAEQLARLQAQQPEQYAELRATAELFPSAIQDSELGEIPKGWAVRDLKSSTTEIRRGISPRYTEDGGIQVINQKCIRNHKINFVLARRNDSSKRKINGREIQIGDVLVNSTGVGTLGRLTPVRLLPEPSVADSHVTVVRANTRLISKAFLAGLMLSSEPFIEASGAGSTGQTELRKQVLEDIMFAMPSLELSATYETIVSPMGQQIACLEEQLTSLARTRDSLLPKLLSGELTIPDAESKLTEIEEAANV